MLDALDDDCGPTHVDADAAAVDTSVDTYTGTIVDIEGAFEAVNRAIVSDEFVEPTLEIAEPDFPGELRHRRKCTGSAAVG